MRVASPRRSAPRRWRRRLFALAALVIGLLAAATLAEIGFRLFWALPPSLAMFDDVGLYVETADGGTGLEPGFRGVFRVGDSLPTDVEVNALGMRGDEVGAKTAGERRVLMLGDSLVFGYGVDQDDSLPAALSRELQATDGELTVGNGGVPGFGMRHSAKRMLWLDPAFQPDAFVFCGYLGNDAVDDLRDDVVICGGLRFNGHLARLVNESLRFRLAVHSRAMLWFETWIFTNRPEWSPLMQLQPNDAERVTTAGLPGDYPMFSRTFAGLFLDVVDENTIWMEGAPPIIPRITANVRESLQLARRTARGRPLVFVVLPTLWQIDEVLWKAELTKRGFDTRDFRRGVAQQRWLEVAEEVGIPAIDVTPALRAVADPKSLFIDAGGHLNRAGSEIVASQIAPVLLRLLQ